MEQKYSEEKKQTHLFISYSAVYLILIVLLPRFGIIRGVLQCISHTALGITGVRIFHKEFEEGFRLWKTHTLRSFVYLLAASIADILLVNAAVIPAALLGINDIGGNTDAVSGIVQVLPLPVIILSLGILGPLTEEIIYRILFVGKASLKLPSALCIILSSVLFALAHLEKISLAGLICVLPAFADALVFAFSYHKTRNIIIPAVLHVLNNSLAFIMMQK